VKAVKAVLQYQSMLSTRLARKESSYKKSKIETTRVLKSLKNLLQQLKEEVLGGLQTLR